MTDEEEGNSEEALKMIVGSQLVTLKVGEFIKSQREMAESMNWSQSTLNRWLKKLVAMNQIRINSESVRKIKVTK